MRRSLIAIAAVLLASADADGNATMPPAQVPLGSVDAATERILNALWNQTDADNSTTLNGTEFASALVKLGITVGFANDTTLQFHQNGTALFNDLDVNKNGQLTKQELANAVNEFPYYAGPLTSAFTNGAGEVPSDVTEYLPTQQVLGSETFLTFTVVVSGPPNAIYPGQRKQIKEQYAEVAGVDVESVVLVFRCAMGGSAGSPDVASNGASLGGGNKACYTSTTRRRLAQVETSIEATIFLPSEAASEAAYEKLFEPTTPLAQTPAFNGLKIERQYEPVVENLRDSVPGSEVAIFAVCILLILPVLLCLLASWWSKKNRSNLPAAPAGCCKNGCCSFNAVGPWAFGEYCGFALVLFCTLFFFVEVRDVVNVATHLLNIGISLVDSNQPFIMGFTENMDMTLIDEIRINMDSIAAVPAAVAAPGIVASAFLLLTSLCAIYPGNKGSYCGTKVAFLIAQLILLPTLVVFIVVASFTFYLSFADMTKHMTTTIRTTCIMVSGHASQIIIDNEAAVFQLEAAGQDITEMSAMLADIYLVQNLLETGCSTIDDMFKQVFDTCLPALLGIIGIIYSLWANQMLCCAAGCCKSPPAEAPASTMTGVTEMTEVQVKTDE